MNQEVYRILQIVRPASLIGWGLKKEKEIGEPTAESLRRKFISTEARQDRYWTRPLRGKDAPNE